MGTTNSTPSIDIPSVEIHDIDTAPEKRPRTLKHLIRANHVNYAILFHNLEYHNHLPHVWAPNYVQPSYSLLIDVIANHLCWIINGKILGSAYLLGGGPEHLQEIYDKDVEELDAWKDSPGEVSRHDWRDYLGDRRYDVLLKSTFFFLS